MKRYHPVVAIIFAIIVSIILAYFLSTILGYFALILGGFIATYLSRTNKAILGLYVGLIISIVTILPAMIITNNFSYGIVTFVLTPIFGFIGGYIAKLVRSRPNKNP